MALALPELPKYLVLAPRSTIRLDMHLELPACEIDVSLNNPRPGRSFILLIGHKHGPFVQRVRLAGKARIYFDPESPGDYALLLSNPDREPVVLRMRARGVDSGRVVPSRVGGSRKPAGARPSRLRRPSPDVARARLDGEGSSS